MAIAFCNDITQEYKNNIYNINLEVSGWDTVTLQAIAPVGGTIAIYGTLDGGMSQGQSYPSGNYGAELAINWSPIQAVNLATGVAVNSISGAGIFSIPVNTKFIRLSGGADIYRLLQFNSKID